MSPPGNPVIVTFNMDVEPGVILPEVVSIEGGPGGGSHPVLLQSVSGGNEKELIIMPEPPLEPGDYILTLLGHDAPGDRFLASSLGVPLATTYTKNFRVE